MLNINKVFCLWVSLLWALWPEMATKKGCRSSTSWLSLKMGTCRCCALVTGNSWWNAASATSTRSVIRKHWRKYSVICGMFLTTRSSNTPSVMVYCGSVFAKTLSTPQIGGISSPFLLVRSWISLKSLLMRSRKPPKSLLRSECMSLTSLIEFTNRVMSWDITLVFLRIDYLKYVIKKSLILLRLMTFYILMIFYIALLINIIITYHLNSCISGSSLVMIHSAFNFSIWVT